MHAVVVFCYKGIPIFYSNSGKTLRSVIGCVAPPDHGVAGIRNIEHDQTVVGFHRHIQVMAIYT